MIRWILTLAASFALAGFAPGDDKKPEKPKADPEGTPLELTIKGTTKSVTLNAVKYGEFNDAQMGHRIGYAAETQINRKDFGMRFDMVRDGRFIVSNEVQINIEGELVEVEKKVEAGATSNRAGTTSAP